MGRFCCLGSWYKTTKQMIKFKTNKWVDASAASFGIYRMFLRQKKIKLKLSMIISYAYVGF